MTLKSLALTFIPLLLHVNFLGALPSSFNAVDYPEPLIAWGSAGSAITGDLVNSLVIGVSTTEAKSGLLKALGAKTPTCCDSYGDTSGCLVNAGTDKNNNHWMACYFPGSEEIFDFDVDVMKCIINLHFVQRDSCISVEGSECAKGYGGGLMAGQTSWIGKGHAKANQLSGDQSVTYQAAAESMKGVKIDYMKGHTVGKGAVDLELVDPKAGQFALTEGMYFYGHRDSEC